MLHDPNTDYEDPEVRELAAEARAQRSRMRRYCSECRRIGGCAAGCPEEEMEDEE